MSAAQQPEVPTNNSHLSAQVLQQTVGALLQREQVFQRVVEQLSDGVALLDDLGHILLWNQACEEMTDIPADHALGKPLWEISRHLLGNAPESDETIQRMRHIVQTIIQQKPASLAEHFEISYQLATHGQRVLQAAFFSVQIATKLLIGVVLRNITDYDNMQAQRQAHERYLTLLHDITETALAAADLNNMLQTLAQRLGELICADSCIVTLWNEQARSIWQVAASPGIELPPLWQMVGSCEEQVTTAVLGQHTSIIADNLSDSSFSGQAFASACAVGGLLAVPLLVHAQNLGAVLFLFAEPHTFMTEEVAECEHACRLTALTLSKALLLEEARQRADDFETIARVTRSMRQARTRAEIPPVILDQILNIFEMDGAAFMSHQPETHEILTELGRGKWAGWTGMRIPDTDNVSGKVIATGQVYHDDDLPADRLFAKPGAIDDLKHVVAIPLIIQEQSTGLLWVGSQQPISEKLVRIFSTIGDAVASAIHRQTLHEDLQTQLEALRVAQARLIQSEKLAAIGQLIAGIAHEINNPLTSVLLRAQMTRQQNLSNETLHDLDTIVAEARRAASTVRGLLDFARQRPPERKLTQINDVIKAALDLTAYELGSRHIHWETRLAPDLPLTLADPHQLQQVLINLINNAWQAVSAVHDHGQLDIITCTGNSTFWGSRPNMQQNRQMIRIQLCDNGPGIPQELLSRIFDPFFTTKPDGMGTGLGLSICHGIINEHDGHIWVESDPGQGSIFFIELPIVTQSERTVQENLPGNSVQPATARRILLIDDEASVIEILERLLQRKGYMVDSAPNGTAGLAALFQARYDLILCDMRMPEMSGREFYYQVTAKDPELGQRILFTTGDTINADTRRFLEETKAPYLIKPFEMDDLLARIQEVICATEGAEMGDGQMDTS